MMYDEPRWIDVTPDLAREWLKKNTENRRVRPSWVMYLAAQIRSGNWIPTTDGIGFRAGDGMLIQGQHRLLAVIEADLPARMLVAWNVSPDAYAVMDRGIGRSVSDALKVPATLVADANLIAFMLNLRVGSRVSEKVLQEVVDWWIPAYLAVVARGKNNVAGFGSSAMRVGLGVRWAVATRESDRQYVLEQYAAMVRNDTSVMSRAAAALWKRVHREKLAGNPTARAVGAAVVFHYIDPLRAMTEPKVHSNSTKPMDELKAWLTRMPDALVLDEGQHPYQFAAQKPSFVSTAKLLTAPRSATPPSQMSQQAFHHR